MFKLAAMTFAMRDATIDKLTKVINYHKDFLRTDGKILSNIEEAALKGDDAAKLFLRQIKSYVFENNGNNEAIITKNLKTIKNLEANRNSKGDFLGIDDSIYDILKKTTGENKPKVIRGDKFYKNQANDFLVANNIPIDKKIIDPYYKTPTTTTEAYAARIKEDEIYAARKRGLDAESEADDIVSSEQLNREKVKQDEYAKKVFGEEYARKKRITYPILGGLAATSGLGLAMYIHNKDNNKSL